MLKPRPEKIQPDDISARKNLQWLMILRKVLFIVGSALILIAVYGLSYPIPQAPLWSTIAAFAGFNEVTRWRLRSETIVTDQELFMHLIIDTLGITAMLFFTGGATNPLAWYYLVPLIISATILPQSYTWYMVGITIACYGLLVMYHTPVPDFGASISRDNLPPVLLQHLDHHGTFPLHVFGMWFGFIFSAGIVAYFSVEMSNTIRERDRLLAEAREQVLRDERLVALGALAAGAAHELGTPLGTMAIITHELAEDYAESENADLREKLEILSQQIDRCKSALSVMSASAGEKRAEAGHRMPVARYLDELMEDWQFTRRDASVDYQSKGVSPVPDVVAEHTLTQALVNILDNAADVSPQSVEVTAQWTADWLTLSVNDRGPGLDPKVLEAVGNQPVTTKQQGLGVGLLLAHATVQRMGGQIHVSNRSGGGACIRVILPLLLQV